MKLADILSRRADHIPDSQDCGEDVTLLPDDLFIKNLTIRGIKWNPVMLPNHMFIRMIDTDLHNRILNGKVKDLFVRDAIELLKNNSPYNLKKELTDCKIEEGLILYKGRYYVPSDQELRRDITSRYHDSPIFGHPGRKKTLELINRDFWWPGMTSIINHYVEGCTVCQQNKPITNPPKIPLVPLDRPE